MPALSRDPHLLALRTGRWRWPWALLGTALTIAGVFSAMSSIVAVRDLVESVWPAAAIAVDGTTADPDTIDELKLLVPGDPSSYLVLAIAFLPILLVPIVVYRLLHNRSWGDWPYRSASGGWHDFFRAAVAFLLVVGAGFTIAWFLFPGRFKAIPRDITHLPWLILGLTVVFVQSFAEEVAFKGYLYRVWGAVFPYRWPLVLLLSATFTSLHWDNSDFARDRAMAVIQFMIGSAVSFWLYTRTQGLAAPTGLHWANNIFAMFVLASTPGEFGASAFATYTDPVLSAGQSNILDAEAWISLILGNAAFIALVSHPRSPFFLPRRDLTPDATPPVAPAPPGQGSEQRPEIA